MDHSKKNDFGVSPLYKIGDRVRIWPIFKNPIGRIESVVDWNSFPIKYSVRYEYPGEGFFTETFESGDLTLVERAYDFYCNCETVSGRHTDWCNRGPTLI